MSGSGLGRVTTLSHREGVEVWTGSVLGRDRGHQRLSPGDIDGPRKVIGQYRESHLGGYFWRRFGEEVCRSHAGLDGAERMLDRLATHAHG
jgi:hypothetical protein